MSEANPVRHERHRVAAQTTLDPSSMTFRHAALAAYDRNEEVSAPLRIDDISSWTIVLTCSILAFGGLLLATLGHVELSARGRGVIRAPTGLRPAAAQVGGLISAVAAEIGKPVSRGDLLAEIDMSELRAQLIEAEQELDTARSTQALHMQQDVQLIAREIELLDERASVTDRRIRTQAKEIDRLRSRVVQQSELSRHGLLSAAERDAMQAALTDALQNRLGFEDIRAATLAGITGLQRQRALAVADDERSVRTAEAKLAAARLRLTQTGVRAPIDGIVENVLVSPGDRVDPGALIVQLSAVDVPNTIIAFLPERDRAFVRTGVIAQLEIDRLPVSEFGQIPAQVVSVGRELAPQAEIARLLGTNTAVDAMVRVDLAMTDSAQRRQIQAYLRSGTLLTARIPLRERRIIGLVFDPIRRWLDS